MKILMCTNFAPAFIDSSNVNEGWVSGILKSLQAQDRISVILIFPATDGIKAGAQCIRDNLKCFAYQYASKSDDKELKKMVMNLITTENIDAVHIMGTEYPHALCIWGACKEAGIASSVVISIQGLVSVYAGYYSSGVPERYRIGATLKEIYHKFDSLNKQQEGFAIRGQSEISLLSQATNVIGRTEWDKKCLYELNPDAKYYHNGENLRESFYSGTKWSIDKCEKHSIFVSQAYYPLKGLHHLLKVLPIILSKHPDTRVYVGGNNPISEKPFKRDSYARYLMKLITDGHLQGRIHFCGKLNESCMHDRYLKSHVFVSPSNIENSSNSIGEALILGVPVIASDVGGNSCIVEDGISGILYPLEDPTIMAQQVIRLFDDSSLTAQLSDNAVIQGNKLHDRDKNVKELIDIYETIAR